ncbi:MAG: hypothetical protein ACYS22_10355 [Planctomycetota bacterium]
MSIRTGAWFASALIPLLATGCPNQAAATGATAKVQAVRVELTERVDRLEVTLTARDDQIRKLDEALRARDVLIEEQQVAVASLQRQLGAVTELANDLGDGATGDLKDQLEQMVAALKEGASDRERLRAASERISVELHAMEARFSEDASRFGEHEERLSALKIDLATVGRIVDRLRETSTVPNLEVEVPAIDGRVLLVERTSAGPILLLSVGEASGVKQRYEFKVRRGDKDIAKIRVIDVSHGFSAAHVTVLDEGETVREGDTVTTRAES